MKGTITAELLTSVFMTAHSVRVALSLADRGMFYALLYLLLTDQTQSAGHPGEHVYVRSTIG